MSETISAPVHVGDVLASKYRVERILGQGAMGVVVAAKHTDLHELRAIKFMLPEALEDPVATERFLREARAAARLKSQHVVKVHDVGRLESGAPYIVMEYLEGQDLRTLLRGVGTLSVEDAVLYLVQVCEAVGEAHAAGIVHRDLKPGNLFLTQGVGGAPCIKVLDFGIAKLAPTEGEDGGKELTSTAALLGTPSYMSPEQMRARRVVDARSDIWALGVLLYKVLTGKVPFHGHGVAQLCSSILWDQPEAPSTLRPDLPPGLDAVVFRCIEKDPANRFSTTAELAEALLPFGGERIRGLGTISHAALLPPTSAASPPSETTGESVHTAGTAPPWTQSASTDPGSRRKGAVVGIVLGGLALVGAALGATAYLNPREPIAAPSAAQDPAAPPESVPLSATPPPAPAPEVSAAPLVLPSTSASASASASAPDPPPRSASPRPTTTTKPQRPSKSSEDAFGWSRK